MKGGRIHWGVVSIHRLQKEQGSEEGSEQRVLEDMDSV